jgi:hypothetical protein
MGTASTDLRQTEVSLYEGSFITDVAEGFRAVPVQAWTILIAATALSNLFLALA